MPGHVGTDIILNIGNVHAAADPDVTRRRLARLGVETEGVSDDETPEHIEGDRREFPR